VFLHDQSRSEWMNVEVDTQFIIVVDSMIKGMLIARLFLVLCAQYHYS
jgi:hypothetical protein